MSYQLRDYQRESSDRAVEFLTDGSRDNGIVVLPTGSGKSLVIADIVSRLSEPCLVFQPSREILQQNHDKLVGYGYRPAIWSASFGRKNLGDITLATIGSVIRRPEVFRGMRYCIIDECHGVNAKQGMYCELLRYLSHVRVLGLTATPYRLSVDGFGGAKLKFLTRTRPRVFSKLVHYVQNRELFDRGYLAKLEYKPVKLGFRKDRLLVNSNGTDYTDDSVRRHFRELNFPDQIVRCVQRCQELQRGPVLVFTSFIEESEYVAKQIPGAAVVTAKTSDRDRKVILWRFTEGRVPAVCNVGVLTTGFDYPALQNVILARPTLSLALYYQMIGRVMRPHPDKKSAFVIDMVEMLPEFGRIEDMEITEETPGTGMWIITSQGRQLTNIYYGEKEKAA